MSKSCNSILSAHRGDTAAWCSYCRVTPPSNTKPRDAARGLMMTRWRCGGGCFDALHVQEIFSRQIKYTSWMIPENPNSSKPTEWGGVGGGGNWLQKQRANSRNWMHLNCAFNLYDLQGSASVWSSLNIRKYTWDDYILFKGASTSQYSAFKRRIRTILTNEIKTKIT